MLDLSSDDGMDDGMDDDDMDGPTLDEGPDDAPDWTEALRLRLRNILTAQGRDELDMFVVQFFAGYHRRAPPLFTAGFTFEQCVRACDIEGATEQAIRDAVDRLSDEGELYTTIDDEHFLVTGLAEIFTASFE